jgi:hypothetical protein
LLSAVSKGEGRKCPKGFTLCTSFASDLQRIFIGISEKDNEEESVGNCGVQRSAHSAIEGSILELGENSRMREPDLKVIERIEIE